MKTGSVTYCSECHAQLMKPDSKDAGKCGYCRGVWPPEGYMKETSLRDKAQGLLNTLTMSQWRNLEDGISEPVLDEIEEVLRAVEREALERAAKAVENAKPSHNRNDLAETIRLMSMSGDTGS